MTVRLCEHLLVGLRAERKLLLRVHAETRGAPGFVHDLRRRATLVEHDHERDKKREDEAEDAAFVWHGRKETKAHAVRNQFPGARDLTQRAPTASHPL